MWWTVFPIPFPYFDEYHTHKSPYVTVILLWVNFIVFLTTIVLTLLMENFGFTNVFNSLGVIPSDIIAGINLHTFVTYLFVHTGILHFLGNMWFLYIFGDNVEHNMGKVNFSLFFLISGIMSAIIYVYVIPDFSLVPLVGGAGAISGILGAYIILFPESKLHVILGPGIRFKMSAFWYIWIWFIMQGLFLFIYPDASTSFLVHIAGFSSGILLAFIFGKRIKYKNYKYETSDYLNTI